MLPATETAFDGTDRVALWSLLVVALLISVATDLRSRRIPNWVTLPTAALALGFRFFRHGVGDLDAEVGGLLSGAVAGLGAAGFFALWAARGRIGWGDVKLVGAAGAVFGWPLVLGMLAFIALTSLLQAVVTLLWKGELAATVARMLRLKRAAASGPLYIPFAVAIALGCVWAMWWDRHN